MKIAVVAVFAFISAFSTSLVAAAEQPSAGFRVGYVDLQKALQTVEAGRNAKSSLEKEVAGKKAELEKAQTALQKEAEEFEKKVAIMNDSAKATKQAELQKKFVDLQKSAAESQMNLQNRERELTKPIIDALRGVIEAVGKEKSFQLILERNEGAVLFAQGGEDLTETVIQKFNSENKGKVTSKKK